MPTRPQPQDRKAKKKPIEHRVPIVADDVVLDRLEAARADLATAEQKAQQERDRLFALARTPAMTPAEIFELDKLVAAQVESELASFRDALTAAEDAVEAATTVYTFRSIGRHAYRQLLDEHPPRDEDHAAQREDTGNEQAHARWNGDTFPPALILACCADPQLSEDDVVEIWETWNDAEITELFVAALAVNAQRRVVDLGKARG